MPPKEEVGQFHVRTDINTIHRLDALRIVMRVSRATVINRGLLAGLPALELELHSRLRRLYALGEVRRDQLTPAAEALGIGHGWKAVVEAYAERNARRTYGETLEEMENAAGIEVVEPAEMAPAFR